MEDHRLLNGIGVSDEYNEIETVTELVLTLVFQEDGALPDEANDIDEAKVFPGIIAVIPTAFSFQGALFSLQESTVFQHHPHVYLNLVYDICPPPPKAWV